MPDRYTVISVDTHAGGSHAAYREYLDPQYRERFDEWRGAHTNPWHDLKEENPRKLRNWDNELRDSEQEADGVVGEVLFPNTIPPFFPSFVFFAGPPTAEDYELRRAGIRAHNRWLADFCAERPGRRAGIGQMFMNDVDDAIEDVRWIAENGLRGGVLLPPFPPDAHWVKPLNHPDYDRLWEVCQDLQVPVHNHGGTGGPRYAKLPSSGVIQLAEGPTYARRPLLFLLLSGVFERFPGLRFVMTEQGCSWVPDVLAQLDSLVTRMRANGRIGELSFGPDQVLPRTATEYFRQNVWLGVSFPDAADTAAMHGIGLDRVMWGSDYPHNEGTYPFTREHLRLAFAGWSEADLRKVLGENPARLFGFDLAELDALAARVGPRVDEVAVPLSPADLPAGADDALAKVADSVAHAAARG
ncbi:amidohydrolase family protein [Spirillospora sp. NPDC029432]|uniref:amidohydrolase family protein n=1 Tax=Spirillospora sp. NPDC029432 TaxID=3154599 RepID=UPI0034516524